MSTLIEAALGKMGRPRPAVARVVTHLRHIKRPHLPRN